MVIVPSVPKHVIESSALRHAPDPSQRRDAGATPPRLRAPSVSIGLLSAAVVVALATGSSWTLLGQVRLEEVVMVYLLGVVVVAMRYGYGPSLFAGVLTVLSFNFFFVAPHFTLAVGDARHIVTFAVMFFVAVVISGLTQRVRAQADRARKLAEEAQRARLEVESEQLRNAILSSVSHDLRTPLAVVTGAATTLLDGAIDVDVRRELTETIVHEADRLNRLVQNVLDMTRLEAGPLQLKRQWHVVEEVIGSAIGRVEAALRGREIVTSIPADLSLVSFDALLVEQLLVNLFENAAKYTPLGSPIFVAARLRHGEVEIEVADRGAGIPLSDRTPIFDKFWRSEHAGAGAGLGLTICRAVVIAHGGRIWVDEREGGGAVFRFTLPIVGDPPKLTAELEPPTSSSRPA